MSDDYGTQLGLDGSSVRVRREREPEPDAPQLALGALDVATVAVTEAGERVEQQALTEREEA